MSELVGHILKDLLDSQGKSLLGQGDYLKAILMDVCPDEPKAIDLIMTALDEAIPVDLLQLKKTTDGWQTPFTDKLNQNQGLPDRYSNWVVETWAAALGVIPLNFQPRNLIAESEEEYRDAIRSVFLRWNDLNEAQKTEIRGLQNRLRLDREEAERIWKEVQEEMSRTNQIAVKVSPPTLAPLHNSLGMSFVRIEPGSFLMGSPDYERNRESDETLHSVTLSQPYWMQSTPVTQAQWQKLMGNNPADFKGPQLPIENISWLDINQRFLPALNALGEGKYRLPSEAEWEYAARAGSMKSFYERHDASTLDAYAWYNNNSNFKTHPVGQKQPNAWGLYDMYGNVWEWCKDLYGAYLLNQTQDPQGPARGQGRVMRGGSWFCSTNACRQAARGYLTPETRVRLTGFRLVREPDV
ncbi:MAG: formylglycine-generating enzyme family protein [Candidatus Sericytochromatia bacterium]|nr:formylglycine-generating enzyme family protein [Candidatus Sericytochromatia bacterium]